MLWRPCLGSILGLIVLAAALGGPWLFPSKLAAAGDDTVARGEVVYHAAGCHGCHTRTEEGAPALAGGRALVTPFGTFHSPNITPDKATGLGNWSAADFKRALREGLSPHGDPYYPAFPYTSYSGMTDGDIADLWAYLKAQPAVQQANLPHALDFPYSQRWLTSLWRWLYFDPQVFAADPQRDEAWNRGAYLVRHLGHCGECHSPRNALGAVEQDSALQGNPEGPDGKKVPAIDPKALADWSAADLADALQSGITPEGDFLAGSMAEVIEESTGHLSDADRLAIARYLLDPSP